MKKIILACALAITSLTAINAQTVVLNDNFDAYNTGALVGQGGWTQTGTTNTNPIQVVVDTGTDKSVALPAAGGQDVYKAFSSVTNTPGNSITVEFSLILSAATTGGDYFFHLEDTAGTTAGFYDRFYAKSSTTGYVLGLGVSSGTGSTIDYGTTVLAFNTPYSIFSTYSFNAGADTVSLAVNGAAYSSSTFSSTTTAEPATFAAAALRQGGATSSPTVTSFDDLVITSVVPEPSTYVMLIAGVGAMALVYRRKAGMKA